MKNQSPDIRGYAQMLQDGLGEVVSGEPFRRFLRFIANNPNYSSRNVLLILQQRPDATLTRGFKGWLKENRCVKEGEHGIRINANFQAEDEDNLELSLAMQPNEKKQKKHKFRRISVFDVAQTLPLEGVEDSAVSLSVPRLDNMNPFKTEHLEGQVSNYVLALQILERISPLPIRFHHGIRPDAIVKSSEIVVKNGMNQLQTIHTIIQQITKAWLFSSCRDRDQLEIEAESIAFIVCQYLGLDTSGFSFPHIAQYSFGQKKKSLKQFLDVIQQTALYFIDSIDGLWEANRIGYDTGEYFLFVNPRTAMRLFREGAPLYLVYPGKGELLTTSKQEILDHDGLYATDWDCWFGTLQKAA